MSKWNENKALPALIYRHNFLRRACNTLFRKSRVYEALTNNQKRFLNSDYWATREKNGVRGIEDYIELAPTSYPLLKEIRKRANGNRDQKILDLGCNVGRHLNACMDMGFSNLHGVDINSKCENEMKTHFPQLAAKASVNWMAFEDYLPTVPNKEFDIIFTHGKTIEHVNPRFGLVEELTRVCREWLILGNVGFSTGSFPRFWLYEFEKANFAPVKILQPEHEWCPESPVNRPHSLIVLKRISATPHSHSQQEDSTANTRKGNTNG